MELNNKIRKKDLSGLAVLKSFFCVCEKWSVIFVITKFFLPTNILKRSAIADDRPLFATLHIEVFTMMMLCYFWDQMCYFWKTGF